MVQNKRAWRIGASAAVLVATMLGLSKSQAWNLVDRQVLSSVYIGRRRLVEMSSVEEFIANLPSERSA